MDRPPGSEAAAVLPAWRACLDVEEMPAAHYLGFVNHPMLDAIDGVPKRVLEIGCAAGAFGAALKARHPRAHVTGIEASRAAAAAAGEKLDRVVGGRIEEVDLAALAPEPFDLAVAGDVLEHLVNPWRVLERVRAVMAPRGQLVVSIPNVRNLQVVMPLLQEGRWAYAERGLLDVTHLRFFTFAEAGRMLEETGFVLEGYSFIVSPALADLYGKLREGGSEALRIGRMTLSGVTPREAMEFCAEQYVVRGRVPA